MMDKLKSALTVIAPVIGTALGGPFGGVAATALSKILLGKDNASSDELLNAIQSATPETLLALKNADYDFQLEMQKIQRQSEQALLDDAQNARQRQIEIAKTGKNDWIQPFLAIIITLGFFGMILVCCFCKIDQTMEQMLYMLMGTLSASFTGLVGYYFGAMYKSFKPDITQQSILKK